MFRDKSKDRILNITSIQNLNSKQLKRKLSIKGSERKIIHAQNKTELFISKKLRNIPKDRCKGKNKIKIKNQLKKKILNVSKFKSKERKVKIKNNSKAIRLKKNRTNTELIKNSSTL